MSVTAVIFDMDGTILDTLADLTDGVNAALRHAGYPERTAREVRGFLGNGARRLVERALPSGTSEAELRRVLDWYRDYYEAHAQQKTAPYPGVPELLAALRTRGTRLAVVSNKPDGAARKLAERYFPGVFDAVLGQREGVPLKPAPDALLDAMRMLRAPAAETVYVGDSDVDVETAANAGVACAAVTWGFREETFLREHGARLLVHEPAELLMYLR